MKVTIEVECTPEEARTFMGLPDLTPVHDIAIAEMQKSVQTAFRNMEPEQFVKTWLPAGMAGMEQFQKLFWQSFGNSDKNP